MQKGRTWLAAAAMLSTTLLFPILALANDGNGDTQLERIGKQYGFPMMALCAVLLYHVRQVEQHKKEIANKDREISRLNDLRVKEQRASADQLLVSQSNLLEAFRDVDRTMTVIAERIDEK